MYMYNNTIILSLTISEGVNFDIIHYLIFFNIDIKILLPYFKTVYKNVINTDYI